MNYSIIVIIQFSTYFAYMIYIPHFIFINVEKESNKFLLGYIKVLFSQTDKRHNQRMLLFNFVNKYYFGASVSKRIKENRSWNGNEKEKIQKYKNYEKSINPKLIFNCNNLVIRVTIISC